MQLDLRQAARVLGVDEATVLRWMRRGELPATRVHDQYRFHRVDLLELAAARGIDVPPELVSDPAAVAGALPSLSAALRVGGVQRDVPGKAVPEVLQAVVERLPLPPSLDRGFLLQMLLAREQLGSTGVGNGLALPHPREPLVLRVAAPLVAVAWLAEPVDFGAADGKPVHTLFTLVTPSVRLHLHLLAQLAAALHDPGVAATLAARPPEPELLEAFARREAAPPGSFRPSTP